MHVLGCTRSQAKQNMGKFTAVVKMVGVCMLSSTSKHGCLCLSACQSRHGVQTNHAAKNFKSEMGKRTKAELVSVWTGENKLYDSLGRFDAEVSEALLQGMFFSLTLPSLCTYPSSVTACLKIFPFSTVVSIVPTCALVACNYKAGHWCNN